ncbi:hypothetical protein [Paenibacillus sp. F4]|nr:hypothetical protein [Paenibacillus sp. F4]
MLGLIMGIEQKRLTRANKNGHHSVSVTGTAYGGEGSRTPVRR